MPGISKVKGQLRRGQLIGTYGIGALVPLGEESFMIAGSDKWPVNTPDLFEPRLQRVLNVNGFILPPASPNERPKNDIPVVRFPNMCFCPECKRLAPHKFFTVPTENRCNSCPSKPALVPSRFVVACTMGHIDDFPYFEWVHKGTEQSDAEKHELSIEARGVSASLSDIAIKCSCGKASTMKGSFSKNGLRGITKCKGRRPWLQDNVQCDEVPRTLQRGASNVYFSLTQSALSIPPFSTAVFTSLNPIWKFIKDLPNDALLPFMQTYAAHTEYSPEQLVQAVTHRRNVESGEETAPDERELREQEYEALVEGKAETSAKEEFVCIPAEAADEVGGWFSRVMMVKRLREVRALTSFTRLSPLSSSDAPERRAPLSAEPMLWLPAMEVMGEGVFLRLNEQQLRKWEAQEEVKERAEKVSRNYARGFGTRNKAPDRAITPRFLLIHTLAHVMINQWSLECGYPNASLRERLYTEEEMAGFLIYTAGSDSAGSLGGLVAQAEQGRLWSSLREAIARASWCAADPLCIEAEASGVDSLNLAACHACVLLPETSCEESNRLLDRAMLTGTPEKPYLGFFTELNERI